MSQTSQADDEPLALRVAGLGFDTHLNPISSSTLGELKATIAHETGLPAQYFLLLFRGKKLTDASAKLSDLNIKNRTKLMLLHSPDYAKDKDGHEKLKGIEKELDDIESSNATDAKVVEELVTRACIKLDAVDVGSSDTLRSIRRALLHRAHEIGDKVQKKPE